MSIIFIKQYRKNDNQAIENDRITKDFAEQGITTIFVPEDIQIEWTPCDPLAAQSENVCIIKPYGDTTATRAATKQLKLDLEGCDINSIILPVDTSVEYLPYA